MFKDISRYRVILASNSPRRKELLSLIVPCFEVIPSHIQEPSIGKSPAKSVEHISYLKAEKLSKLENSLIIGADTIVYANNVPLGKPSDAHEAKEMLKKLSNRVHRVYTGVTVINTVSGRSYTQSACTTVSFAAISDSEIDEYIATGDPMDKAGAYGIQGYASRFVKRINGCYFNVVGLPVRLTYRLLCQAITL